MGFKANNLIKLKNYYNRLLQSRKSFNSKLLLYDRDLDSTSIITNTTNNNNNNNNNNNIHHHSNSNRSELEHIYTNSNRANIYVENLSSSNNLSLNSDCGFQLVSNEKTIENNCCNYKLLLNNPNNNNNNNAKASSISSSPPSSYYLSTNLISDIATEMMSHNFKLMNNLTGVAPKQQFRSAYDNDDLYANDDELLKFEEESLIKSTVSSSSTTVKKSSLNSSSLSSSSTSTSSGIDCIASTDLPKANKKFNRRDNIEEMNSSPLLINFGDDECSATQKKPSKSTGGFNLDILAKTNNIVAAIDPTFTRSNPVSSDSGGNSSKKLTLQFDNVLNLYGGDNLSEDNLVDSAVAGVKPSRLFKYKTGGTKCDYSSITSSSSNFFEQNESTDIFLPVPGQKRGITESKLSLIHISQGIVR